MLHNDYADEIVVGRKYAITEYVYWQDDETDYPDIWYAYTDPDPIMSDDWWGPVPDDPDSYDEGEPIYAIATLADLQWLEDWALETDTTVTYSNPERTVLVYRAEPHTDYGSGITSSQTIFVELNPTESHHD